MTSRLRDARDVWVCGAHGDLRVGKDLEKDFDMVDYSREVVRRRVLEE